MRWDGTGFDGMGWVGFDTMGWDGMQSYGLGLDVMGCNGVGWGEVCWKGM